MVGNNVEIRLRVDSRGAVKEIKSFHGELDQGSKRSEKSVKSLTGAANTLRNAFIGLGAIALGKQLISIADSYTQIEGRLRLVTSSTAELNAVQKELYAIAQRSRAEFTSTADVFNRFAQATKGTGVSQQELLGITETLNKAFVISGASTAEAGAAMVQLSQGFASGVLRGDEFNSIMESGGRVVDLLTSHLGVSRGELRSMAEDGKITAEVMRGAFAEGAAAVNAEFEQMPITVGQATTVLASSFKQIVADSNSASGATGGIAESVLGLAESIDENREGIVSLFVSIIDLAGDAVSAIGNIGQSIEGWAAVGEGKLGFLDFATMNAEELTRWLERDKIGLVAIGQQLESLNRKHKEVAQSWAFTSESRQEKQAQLRDIENQIDALERQKLAAESLAAVIGDDYVDSWLKVKPALNDATLAAGDTTTMVGDLSEETEKNRKAATSAADAWQRYQVQMTTVDGWLSRNQGMEKANERAEEMIATLSDLDALVSDGSFYEIADTIEVETKKATETSEKLWDDFVGNTGDILNSFVSDTVRGEFDSIEDLFDGMLDSMLSMLLDFISKAAANSLLDAIFGEGASGEGSLKLGSLVSGLFSGDSGGSDTGGGSGGYSIPTGGAGGAATKWIAENVGEQAASYVSTAAGAVGVAGGVYGMYSGIKDMSEGNVGTGAVKTGLGAASTYKGAVTLGIVEEGAATKLGQSIAQGLSSYYGGASSAYSAGGAMMHVGGSVAEGGALAAGGASSAGGGGAAGAGAAGGGLSLASAGVGGIYATAAMIGLKIAMGNPQSLAQKKRDQLNAGGTTPGDIVGAGATEQLSLFGQTLMREVNPALNDATVGSYNAGSGLLVLGKRTEEFVRTGADGQGKLVDAMTYDTWRWDALSQAWKTVNSPIDGLVDQLHKMAPATQSAAAAAATMITAQAGYPDLADEVLTIYNDQKTGMMQLGGEHRTLAQAIGASSSRAHNASSIAWQLSEATASAAGAADTAAGAELRRRGSLLGSVEAISSATANMNAQRAATESLATSSGAAAQRIGQAAGDIGGAVNRIGGLLGRAATYSVDKNADGAIYSYHAAGGVMTGPTVFHVGGEVGDEAIMPLHAGPDTVKKMDAKLDAILSGGSGGDDDMKAILLAIAAQSKKTADILRRFEYTGIPESTRQATA